MSILIFVFVLLHYQYRKGGIGRKWEQCSGVLGNQFFHHCSYPTAHNWGCCVYGLVLSFTPSHSVSFLLFSHSFLSFSPLFPLPTCCRIWHTFPLAYHIALLLCYPELAPLVGHVPLECVNKNVLPFFGAWHHLDKCVTTSGQGKDLNMRYSHCTK